MKKINYKIVISLIVLICMLVVTTSSQAFSLKLSTNATNVNKGDKVTVNVAADEKFVTADFKLKYDSSVLEYVEETQSNLTVKDYSANGYLIAVYADLSGVGTNSVSIKFRSKAGSNSVKISVDDQNFTTVDGTSFDSSNITSNVLDIAVKDSNSNNGNDSNNNNNNNNNDNNNNSNNNGSNNNSNTNGSNSSNTNGNNTNSNTTNKTNTINANNANNASSVNGKLPYAGVGSNILIALIVIAIIIAIVFRKKAKYWKGIGMFVIIFSCTLMFTNNNIYAYSKISKYGKYSNLIANQKIFAISLDKSETNRELKVSEISNLEKNVSYCKDTNGVKLEDTSTIGTGSKIVLKDNTEYTVLLYADVNGDGKINSNDIYPIIKHILKEKQLSGVYAKAANLNNKNDLNDANINSSDIYPIIKFILGDLSTDLVTTFPGNADVEIQDLTVTATYSETNWTNKDVKVTITANKEIEIPTELSGYSAVLSSDKKQIECVITENMSKNVIITDKDGISKVINIKVENIDKKKPVVNGQITVSSNQVNSGSTVTVSIPGIATDTESGIQKMVYTVLKDNNKMKEAEITQNTEYTITPEAGASYTIQVYAVDNAGNTSDVKSYAFSVVKFSQTEEGAIEQEQLKRQQQAEIQAIENSIKDVERQENNLILEYNNEIDQLEHNYSTELSTLEKEYNNSLKRINSSYEDDLRSIESQKDEEVTLLNKELEDQLEQATSDEERNDISANFQASLKAVQTKYQNLLDITLRQKNDQVATLEQIIAKQKQELETEKDKKIATAEDTMKKSEKELEQKKSQLLEEIKQKNQKYDEEIGVLDNKLVLVNG